MLKFYLKYSLCFIIILLLSNLFCSSSETSLTVSFNGKYGQLEIGGKYIGLAFHQSRPLPSRISFYYPVANSIDFSTDYWQRYKSFPFNIILKSNTAEDTLGLVPYEYLYTPYHALFRGVENDYRIIYSYDVCQDFPAIVLKIVFKNITKKSKKFELETILETSLRTSHTYNWKRTAMVQYLNKGSIAISSFDDIQTDSACVFIANAGELPIDHDSSYIQLIENPSLRFFYKKKLEPDDQVEIVQLIGMCRQNDRNKIINRTLHEWLESVLHNQERILDYTYNHSYFFVADSGLQQTIYWAKALLASNIHYINGKYLPMPCPAEYNFFFTHDLFLTDLGAVYFDINYVREGIEFLYSLTKADSILPHAYYWKDTQFITEYCASDNWNHLWFIIVSASYLRHSGDMELLEKIYPLLKKSLLLLLENKGEDGLMYARRPDWWDIGNKYGARVYVSALMYKALNDYVYILSQLREDDSRALSYLQIANEIKEAINEHFWDDQAGYLFNMLDEKRIDRHYYSGSLVAAWYGVVNGSRKTRLLATARNVLLDKRIGLRNAMPNDFHNLASLYNFVGGEEGMPYFYFNGAVWPHGNVWYALGLLNNDQPDTAKWVIKKYLTLAGIKNSPNGQPSFYEYRVTDQQSDRYGEIDKPSFLWAGGLFLHVIYQLAGLRENSYNIYFSPNLPQGFENVAYDLTLYGKLCRVKWTDNGKYFKKIIVNDQLHHSAVITASAKNIFLIRGLPEKPYLAEINCNVHSVEYLSTEKKLIINFSGIIDQNIDLSTVSPYYLKECNLNGVAYQYDINKKYIDGIYTYQFLFTIDSQNNTFVLSFE